jgi:hypothetical protein
MHVAESVIVRSGQHAPLYFANCILENPVPAVPPMADYTKYDPRVDSLVVEARTLWSKEVENLPPEDKELVAESIHRHPKLASEIAYERAHTGFTRIITVHPADLERLVEEV